MAHRCIQKQRFRQRRFLVVVLGLDGVDHRHPRRHHAAGIPAVDRPGRAIDTRLDRLGQQQDAVAGQPRPDQIEQAFKQLRRQVMDEADEGDEAVAVRIAFKELEDRGGFDVRLRHQPAPLEIGARVVEHAGALVDTNAAVEARTVATEHMPGATGEVQLPASGRNQVLHSAEQVPVGQRPRLGNDLS